MMLLRLSDQQPPKHGLDVVGPVWERISLHQAVKSLLRLSDVIAHFVVNREPLTRKLGTLDVLLGPLFKEIIRENMDL